MFSLGEIIDLAIQVEKNGEKSYRKAQKEVKDRNLASVLEWLADDEKEHEKWFHDLKKGID
ncbi:MAG: rubrerythrin, partial [Deltaproteobacteria bacterium]|nr:rubrerythrin [Deltaproteobacteria bacterium]